MENGLKCPACGSEHVYQDGDLWICPECAHEWNPATAAGDAAATASADSIHDANGTLLTDGDSVTLIKDLKVKGSSQVLKGGTKVKNIRLVVGAGDGHDISCRIDGIGVMNLKSEFVKKA